MKERVFCTVLAVVCVCLMFSGMAVAASTQSKSAPSSSQKSTPSTSQSNTYTAPKSTTTVTTVPKDVSQTPTGKVLKDTATGAQSAAKTFDGSKDTTPPVVNVTTTTARTPEQAIKEYKESGNKPGPNTLKIKEPPAPGK